MSHVLRQKIVSSMIVKMYLVAIMLFSSAVAFAQEPASKPKEATLPESRPSSAARYTKVGDLPGVMAVVRFSDRLLRGAQPQDDKGMAELKKLGVTTILSVEEPDQAELDAAKRAGLNVVNIPTEYNGLPTDVVNNIVTTYRGLEGTVYAHCHHGKHRGGTASAILRMTFEGVPQLETIQEMAELGCSKRYPGLYDTLRKYRPNPAIAHRVLKPRPGIDALIEVTPWIFRGTSTLTPEALTALKDLGIKSILSADMPADAQQRARAAGFNVVMLAVTIEREIPEERKAILSALGDHAKEKVFLHANDDLAKAAAMVAAFRLGMSLWSPDEAAREVEALVPNERGAKLATLVRGVP